LLDITALYTWGGKKLGVNKWFDFFFSNSLTH